MHASASSAPPAPGLAPPRDTCRECATPLIVGDAERYCPGCGLVPDDPPFELVEVFRARPTTPIPSAYLPRADLARPTRRRERAAPRGVARARAILNRLSDDMHLPSFVAIDAFRLFRRLHARGETQGRRLEATCAACLLEAARDRGVSRTAREVAAAADVPLRQLYAALDTVAQVSGSRVLPAGPTGILPRVASEAGVPTPVEAAAAQILRDAHARTAGRRPEPMAAAALLLAARRLGAEANASKLAKGAGVSRQALYVALHELEASSQVECHAA